MNILRMQDFHPDCTINLLVHSHGKGNTHFWACSLVTRKSVRLIVGEKFFGLTSREQAEWSALEFGLIQGLNLKQEKIAIASLFLKESELTDPRKLRDPELQLKKANCFTMYNQFRLRKFQTMNEEERAFLKNRMESFFARGKKRSE